MIPGLALTYVVHIAEVARKEPAIDKQPTGCMQVSVHTTKMTQEIYTAYVPSRKPLFSKLKSRVTSYFTKLPSRYNKENIL